MNDTIITLTAIGVGALLGMATGIWAIAFTLNDISKKLLRITSDLKKIK